MSAFRMWIRVLLVVAVLGGAGYLAWRFLLRGDPEKALAAAESAYEAGKKAADAKDYSTAILRFDEASLQASTCLDNIDQTIRDGGVSSVEAGERYNQMAGRAAWIKAQALRDRTYAAAQQSGKPLREATDATTGEKFPSILAIVDDKDRSAAYESLNIAARTLPKEYPVQLELLRVELMQPLINWERLNECASRIAAIKPQDSRPHYLMAKYEFEQPSSGRPAPPSRRSRTRVETARDHIVKAREGTDAQLWRTLYLEARIREWLGAKYAEEGKDDRQRAEEQALHALLFDEKAGALARAARGEGMTRVSDWDLEGILGLHDMALEQALIEARKKDAAPEPALAAFDSFVEFGRGALTAKTPTLPPGRVASAVVEAAVKAQPVLAGAVPTDWKKRVTQVQELADLAQQHKAATPGLCGHLADLLTREAFLEGKRGSVAKQEELTKQAQRWIDEGLKLADASKSPPPDQVIELHTLAASMKVIGGGKRADIQPHITALRKTKIPRAEALANLFEGVLLEREGKLDRARTLLEQATQPEGTEIALRAHLVLGNVYTALGQPEKALTSLRVVDRAYASFNELADLDKAWIKEFVRGPDDVAYSLLVTNLATGRSKAAQFLVRNPGKEMPANLLLPHEKEAAALLKKLPPRSEVDRRARMALVGHYLVTNRVAAAREVLGTLQKNYPDSVEVLQLEVAVLRREAPEAKGAKAGTLDEAARRKIDEHVGAFLKNHPGSLPAKLYWAVWLTQSGRAGEAVKYLQDPANFQDEKDPRYQRVLANALLGKGDREAGVNLLKHMPQDATIDVALLRFASPKERRDYLEKALGSYEDKGLFLIWEAALDMEDGKHEKAAEGYLKAIEYSRVASLARRGVQRAAFALAQAEPGKTKKWLERLFKEYPDEPSLTLGYAYACLLLDEVGQPNDEWQNVKTMGSALNHWGEQMHKAGMDDVAALLTRSEFWAAAGRPDLGRSETERALRLTPKSDAAREAALTVATQLAMTSLDSVQLNKARLYLYELQKMKPEELYPRYLAAQVDETDNKIGKAIEIYEGIVKDRPKETVAYLRLFVLLTHKEGDLAKARDLVKRWREQFPQDVFGAQAEVYLLAKDKQVAEGQKVIARFMEAHEKQLKEEIAKLKPAPGAEPKKFEEEKAKLLENSLLATELELIKGLTRAGAYSEAEADLRRLMEKRKDFRGAQLLLGEVLMARKDWAGADKVYREILKETDGLHLIAGNNLAWILAKHLKNPAEALKVAERVRQGKFSGKPISGDRLPESFLDTLGVVYQSMKDGPRAAEMRDLFEAAQRRYPADPRMSLYLGHAHANLGDTKRAIAYFTQAERDAGPSARTTLNAAQRQEVLQAAQEELKRLTKGG